jgi:hypothetical protein
MYVPVRFCSYHITCPHGTDDQIHVDQAPIQPIRSPSPLFEVDETPSPELTEVPHLRRRASESVSYSTHRDESSNSTKRRGYSISTPSERVHLDSDEKARRAAAAEGLSKGDKRRMQNKLAQRAFRARSKVVNKHVCSLCFDSLLASYLTNRRLVDWNILRNLPSSKLDVLVT